MEDSIITPHSPAQQTTDNPTRKGCLLVMLVFFVIMLSPLIWRRSVIWYYSQKIHSANTVPEEQVAIVFGAAIYRNGRLSSVLRDRMDTAITLYNQGKVEKILVSGHSQNEFYDEPGAMKAYAIQNGVLENDILTDNGGNRTYDTCYRGRHIFQLESATLVTQNFHLPRAIFTCQRLGVEAQGVAADLRPYRGMRWYEFRETLATIYALWDVIRKDPPPILDEPDLLE